MALSDYEKAQVRLHLGYSNLTQGQVAHTGVLFEVPLIFKLDQNMENILPEAEEQVRRYLTYCDTTEEQIFCAQKRLKIAAAEEVEFRNDEIKELWNSYVAWAQRLADVLLVKLYQPSYLNRFGKKASQVYSVRRSL